MRTALDEQKIEAQKTWGKKVVELAEIWGEFEMNCPYVHGQMLSMPDKLGLVVMFREDLRQELKQTKKYLREANRGAATNSMALQLSAFQYNKLALENLEWQKKLQAANQTIAILEERILKPDKEDRQHDRNCDSLEGGSCNCVHIPCNG